MGKYKKIAFLLLLVLLASCSPIKRHARLVKKYPFVHKTDTVVLVDTLSIIVPKVQKDTIMLLDSFIIALKDTIVIEKDKLKVRITQVHDSIYIDAKCDTVYLDKVVEIEVPVKYYEHCDELTFKDYLKYGGISLLILVLILSASKITRLFK
jgi:hypothetical protein